MRRIPLRRHADTREMAGNILCFASDAASYTNGECIVVDGGLTI
jgi:NAD(P)-dependent dehydrogenase (short-subunit alcohol dehydrogenase family)